MRECSPIARADTSGVRPIFSPSLRLAELVATLALAQDNAFGQPLESQLRSCLLASWLCEEAEFDDDVRTDAYWVSLLRYIGCTGHAHEVATLFGDEIAIRAQTLVHDAGNPAEVMRDVFEYATAWRPEDEREAVVKMIQETAHEWAVNNFASGCEVADMLVVRLDFGPSIREALACTFERWNGKGFPRHVSGDAIPLPMRIVHLSHDMEAIGRLFSPERAIAAARDRRDETYDPALADLFLEHGAAWFERLRETEPWDAVLALEPEPRRMLEGEALDHALEVAADFIDLKSSYWGGHSRRCAQLAADAARVLGFTEEDTTALRRAALVHDFGTSAVPNSIWDKPGPLTRTEFDRVELHPMLTEQMLRRSPAFAALTPAASAHHEKCNGSGYHRRLRSDTGDRGACVLAATEIYVGMTTERADRPPILRRRGGRRAASPRIGRRARAERNPRRSRRCGPRRARGPCAEAAPESGRAVTPGGRRAPTRRAWPHDPPDRRPARHLPQDRRPPHPAHLHEDRRLDPSRRRSLGDAERLRRRLRLDYVPETVLGSLAMPQEARGQDELSA